MKKIILFLLLIITLQNQAQVKILFDNTKAESVGSADWVIDADTHNLGFSSGPAQAGSGTESNAQRIPTLSQSGITSTTPETYWEGALSYWAIDCVRQGYTVESLPYNVPITYGVTTNVQDLSNYKVFVIDEPNILFTAAEKTAILNFVHNGGGLCMISDHDVSDRNNDGQDSPHIWNDLMTTNSVGANPFGITFDYVNISPTSTNVAALPTNPVLHGTFGNVTKAQWSNGTTMTLSTTANSTVKGLIYNTGASTTGLTNVMIASSTYGTGKIVAIGDSSIPDDGTGDPNDTLYTGYSVDASGNHRILLMNAIIWLATTTLSVEDQNPGADFNFTIAPNPIQNNELKVSYNLAENDLVTITVFDTIGRAIKTIRYSENTIGFNTQTLELNDLKNGVYFCKVGNTSGSKTVPFIVK